MLDNPQEWSEGTADYIERRFTALAGIEDARSLQEVLSEPFEVEADWARDMFGWDRFYASGDAVCVLMDRDGIARDGIAWRPAMTEGKTPYDVLADALSLSSGGQADLLAQAQETFDYSSLLA